MNNTIPELMVDNIEDNINFYTNILDFKMLAKYPESNPSFLKIKNGNTELMLFNRKEFSKEIPQLKDIKIGGSFVLYINVDNINELYEDIKDKVNIIKELHNTDYGTMEFVIEDINGYILMFNQRD